MVELGGISPEEYLRDMQILTERLHQGTFAWAVSEVDPMKEIFNGIDIIEVDTIRRRSPAFFRGNFTEAEREYCETYGEYRAQPYAARWAAKEGVLKAFGHIPRGNWIDVEVLRETRSVAEAHLYGATKDHAERLGVEQLRISLAHTNILAAASVFIVKRRQANAS